MIASGKLFEIVALLVSLLVIPARANSINAHNSSTKLDGASGIVSGSFTFDHITGTFLNRSVLFASPSFGNPTLVGNFHRMALFGYNGPGHFQGLSHFNRHRHNGSVSTVSVPEGGDVSYLVLSALAILVAMLLASRQNQKQETQL